MMWNSTVRSLLSKRLFLIAIICLIVLVVALGAAAKHSQFVSPLHSTHYLTQSVKMVSGSHQQAVEPPLKIAPVIVDVFLPAVVFPEPVRVLIALPVPAPLLI